MKFILVHNILNQCIFLNWKEYNYKYVLYRGTITLIKASTFHRKLKT